MMRSVKSISAMIFGLLGIGCAVGCGGGTASPQQDGGDDGGIDAASTGEAGNETSVSESSVVVSAASRKPRTTTWSINYWMWSPTYGNDIAGTEPQVAALKPAIMRVGGYNNDANTPDPFDDAELDKAVAYARAIAADPVIQVPLIADIAGARATADSAAAMVKYANVTKGYGIKYFSIGNEPKLYATQGALVDMSKPAFPGFGPTDYCTAARAFVTAMKAVDPTIKIIGPDLSWHYQPGNDWLSPILRTCGDLFDIVSIHRYPFSSTQATLTAAASDATSFANLLSSVRSLMSGAGQGDKPLALMEMNVVYDATSCALGASPKTMGSALWLGDALGTAIEHDLWTSAVWDVSDDESYALGLIGPAPAHTPRPEYYAYQLYADHFGPTLLDVTAQPSGVRTYASRNQADDATELIVVNWNTSSEPLAFQIDGLATSPTATFTLPGLSISAVEIPDTGAAAAWTYADAQRKAGQGPAALVAGASAAMDGGVPRVPNACSDDASVVCATIPPPGSTITTMGVMAGQDIVFGTAPNQWHSYVYAASGQTNPTVTLTDDANGINVSGSFVLPLTGGTWEGVGFYFDNSHCIDAKSFTGLKFDFAGDLGDCSLALGANFSGNDSTSGDPGRGSCPGTGAVCYPPMSTVMVPVSMSDGGHAPDDGGAADASGTIDATSDAGTASDGALAADAGDTSEAGQSADAGAADASDVPDATDDPTAADASSTTDDAALSSAPPVTTIKVPFTSFSGGSPNSTLDPSTIITVQWQLNAPAGKACSASFTVSNLSFY